MHLERRESLCLDLRGQYDQAHAEPPSKNWPSACC
jgi:hypothetical protein